MKKLACLLLVLVLLAFPLTSRAADGSSEDPTPAVVTEPNTEPTIPESSNGVSPSSADTSIDFF